MMFVFVRILYVKKAPWNIKNHQDLTFKTGCLAGTNLDAVPWLASTGHILSSSHELHNYIRAVPEIILKEKEWNTIIYTFWPERTAC